MTMRRTKQYREGWKACETGASRVDNPYSKRMPVSMVSNGDPTLLELAALSLQWADGFEDRASRGFDTAHLPRKPCSDAFAF